MQKKPVPDNDIIPEGGSFHRFKSGGSCERIAQEVKLKNSTHLLLHKLKGYNFYMNKE